MVEYYILLQIPQWNSSLQLVYPINKYCPCFQSLIYFLSYYFVSVPHTHANVYSSMAENSPRNALFPPVWVLFDKNYSAQLCKEITVLIFKWWYIFVTCLKNIYRTNGLWAESHREGMETRKYWESNVHIVGFVLLFMEFVCLSSVGTNGRLISLLFYVKSMLVDRSIFEGKE